MALGVGVSPVLESHQELRGPNFGAGSGTIGFSAQPPLTRLRHLGARLGFDYGFAKWGSVSGIYDNFWEDAKMTVPAFLAPLKTSSAMFHETTVSGGVRLRPTRHLTLVLERDRASLSSRAYHLKARNTYYGSEWQASQHFSVRAGSNGGSPTLASVGRKTALTFKPPTSKTSPSMKRDLFLATTNSTFSKRPTHFKK